MFAVRAALVLLLGTLWARSARGDVEMPVADVQDRVVIRAEHASHWPRGQYEVWHLTGNCLIAQGDVAARCEEAVLWIDQAEPYGADVSKVIAYLEGRVSVEHRHRGAIHQAMGRKAQTVVDSAWLGRFHTVAGIDIEIPSAIANPSVKPAALERGLAARDQELATAVERAQFLGEQPPRPEEIPPPGATTLSLGGQRIRIEGRSHSRLQGGAELDPVTNETVFIASGGIKAIIEGVAVPGIQQDLGNIVIQTDRMVLWAPNLSELDLSAGGLNAQNVPVEIYLEGNIEFRQGDRVIYADRMYYNLPQQYGVVLNAEALTPVQDYQGLLRLKADVLKQLDRHNFEAYGAALTSSRMGVPRYWLQAQQVAFQDIQRPVVNPINPAEPVIDPRTNDLAVDHQLLATSRNNFLYVGGVPVFYWPVIATDLVKPTYYIEEIGIQNDNVFGTQLRATFDAYQLLGIRNKPVGTNWTFSTDILSKRGLGGGTHFDYDREGLFGFPGPYRGVVDLWGIKDDGLDDLGADRRAVVPATDKRGRLIWRHRQELLNGYVLTGELGWISDRNFLEEYFEQEWDDWKDQTTNLELKRYVGNTSWDLLGAARINDFFTQTEWARGDHFLVGHSFLLDHLTWYAHTHVGYAGLKTAELPPPGSEPPWASLPWETTLAGTRYNDRSGLHTGTRQELDLPLDLGPVKVVPYVLGEIAHWQEDRDQQDLTRAYGQIGVRGSLPLWTVDPTVQSSLLNLNGLAHKVVFDAEMLWADASQDSDRLPLYDPLDDDAQEHFRRRFINNTFGGVLPARFDPRTYAFRSAMQSWVTAPTTEIADDLTLVRLGVDQRWQTKRGLPGQERIIDWIVFDIEGVLFPKPGRDNFGESFGLFDYDFRWHVGDRFTLLSDGFFDFFSDGLRVFSLGGLIGRPERGSLFVGFRSIEGPITSNVVGATLSYRMSEKWIVDAGTTFDLGPAGNIGQNIAVVRVGESALVRLGMTVDNSRNNVGVQLAVEPRFLPRSRLGRVGGVQIPPAGARGFE